MRRGDLRHCDLLRISEAGRDDHHRVEREIKAKNRYAVKTVARTATTVLASTFYRIAAGKDRTFTLLLTTTGEGVLKKARSRSPPRAKITASTKGGSTASRRASVS